MYLWNIDKQPAILARLCSTKPLAAAQMVGNSQHPALMGTVSFYPSGRGTLVTFAFYGLPQPEDDCAGGVFGLHIHEGTVCSGNSTDPFADALGHYNPNGCPHPYHAGDLPPVFSSRDFSWGAFYTEKFSVFDVLGKTVILHSRPDDFKTQPAGDAGERIACGVIEKE